ncbi:MAG: SDR family oxidoreductase [Trueperaceae bacterium]
MVDSYLSELFDMRGRVAVVTGASRGLGQSMALALARAGARICLVGRQDNLGETARLVEAQAGDSCQVICQLTESSCSEAITTACLDRWGRLDVLVNNAGTFIRKPAADWTMEDWDQVVDVNLRSVFELCRRAGRIMLSQGAGKIINIASVLAFQGGITVPGYAASRHGVIGLTRALANEWAGSGVNVNAIAPGYMATDQNADLFADADRSATLLNRIPAGRWGTANDIDGACLFLASDASSYMHGQVLVVDGGWLSR